MSPTSYQAAPPRDWFDVL